MKFTRPELAMLYQTVLNEMTHITQSTPAGYSETLQSLEKKLSIIFKK